ncbi:MAG: FAD:protein FMN transferase [Oscillospiraceae bacterium]|jgi:hypothetical protein|nr:FAD:protein FMN transferase [Oscillospiraceae bacterium]
MDTVMSLTAYGGNAETAVAEAERAVYNVAVPGETKESVEILKIAERARIMTDGAFDVYYACTGEPDFGGIAKGYAADEAAEIFRENGIKSGLINLGGNIYVVGNKTSGKPWEIAVQSPFDENQTVGTLKLADTSAVTSGVYRRGEHIIDPATGLPADSGLASVTVVCENSALADALSTGLFVLGRERALEIWRENRDLFDLVLIEEDGTVTVTEGLESVYSSGGKHETAGSGEIGIFLGGELVQSVDLNAVAKPYDLNVGGGNVAHIERGEVYMLEADCPDQICVKHAHLRTNERYDGDTPIVCLPNNVVIKWI